ncbi:MAG TPA: gamma-glutamyltransferase [Ilumatobacteraceae bacterium]|nr:gamma-glutamyltransferase [Ilumatobacteraceae bacterium]HRB01909.1 gamma-glutamyltransferase [Ilumatobacteraceae bacterium]
MKRVHEVAVMAAQCSAFGRSGVVSAAAPLAAQAGAAALHDGGNAYDAAVAAALAETVLLPPKCGFGGDLIALRLTGGAAAPDTLLAIGGAPAGLGDVARAGTWRDVGPMSVGPPAAAHGYAELASLGRLGRARLAAPAIALALDGFPWATVCTQLAEQAAVLVREMNPDGNVYYPNGQPITPGALTRLPGLAAVLAEFVTLGSHLLEGDVGAAVARAVRERGGVLTEADFGFAGAEWVPCATGRVATADGHLTTWATPAPTHGPSLLDVAQDLRPGGSQADLFEAVRRAISVRRETLSDPSGTSMVSAADAEGNVVVIVHSNSFPRFGSGIIVPEYSLPLANRAGRGFTPEVGHRNFPTVGRRPATTLHAWAVAGTDGLPRFLGATPGGANQMPWNAQTIARIAAGVTDPGVHVASPIWEWLPADDGVRIEAGFPDTEVAALNSVASRTVDAPRWGCKSAQQLVRVPRDGELWCAAADPRTVGLALGV